MSTGGRIANFLTLGALDRRKANEIVASANEEQEEAKRELDERKALTQRDLEALGALRERVYSTTIFNFAELYTEIGAVDKSPLRRSNTKLGYQQVCGDLSSLKQVSVQTKELAAASGAGVLGGAVAACGAYGLAGLVGTASTGTAIGTLSGVAASNATLAWLGGGALSAGGAGVTGGMVVLGGVALAPLAVVAMFLGVNKGKQKLNAAMDYQDQVEVLVERIKTLIGELDQIRRGTSIVSRTIDSLDGVMVVQLAKMQTVIGRLRSRSAIWKYLFDPIRKLLRIPVLKADEQVVLIDSVNCACLLREFLDLPVMSEEGGPASGLFDLIEARKDKVSLLVGAPVDSESQLLTA